MEVKDASGGGGGDHHEASNHSGGNKRYNRHTTEQIQVLEAMFNQCPHADEQTRLQLSRELGLTPRQIKFWFQNRRTQMKAKSEMADNCLLKEEIHKIRSENIAFKEALKNAICPTCGGPPGTQDDCHEEQRLSYENAQLKKELERACSIMAKYTGRPLISQSSPAQVQPSHLSMATDVGDTQQRMITMASSEPSLNLNLLTTGHIGASASTIPPSHPLHLTEMDKSQIASIASSALDELMRLFQTNEPLWTKSVVDGRDVLDIDTYEMIFPRPTSMKSPNLFIEASRATADVMMDSMQIVEMFIDSAKWRDLFPSIVLKARTIEVFSTGFFGNLNGSLQLMYEELQVASPLVPIRQFIFIRSCQRLDPDTWAIVDVSYDLPHEVKLPYVQLNSRRLPSGCLIQSMPNGYSKVTWIEHVEIEEKTSVHRLYRDLVYSGLAFGAERWVACLQRSCERIACQMVTHSSICELGGDSWTVIPSAEGKKGMMKLAQRMVNNFCASICPCDGYLWSCVSGFDDFEVHATLYKSKDPVQLNAVILRAAATVWLRHSPQFVFDFLRDERNRPQWDMLANHNPIEEATHIANGAHPGNCISILRAQNINHHNNILILQESCTNSSGSLVVYCPVDLPVINIALSGEEPDISVPLLPSGFAITTDGRHNSTTSPSGSTGGGAVNTGSLVTLVSQMMVTGLPGRILGAESVATINNLIGRTVRKIKAAMN